MELKDLQLIIPGWNIVYIVREHKKGMREIEEARRASPQEYSAKIAELRKKYY